MTFSIPYCYFKWYAYVRISELVTAYVYKLVSSCSITFSAVLLTLTSLIESLYPGCPAVIPQLAVTIPLISYQNRWIRMHQWNYSFLIPIDVTLIVEIVRCTEYYGKVDFDTCFSIIVMLIVSVLCNWFLLIVYTLNYWFFPDFELDARSKFSIDM